MNNLLGVHAENARGVISLSFLCPNKRVNNNVFLYNGEGRIG